MEGAFGADFSGVRIHADETAAKLNTAVSARAFTTGQDIFFGKGQLAPETAEGERVLAHELAHTLQPETPAARMLDNSLPGATNSSVAADPQSGGHVRRLLTVDVHANQAPQNEVWAPTAIQLRTWVLACADPVLQRGIDSDRVNIDVHYQRDDDDPGETFANYNVRTNTTDIVTNVRLGGAAVTAAAKLEELKRTLLHELSLHARPAVAAHFEAIENDLVPNFEEDTEDAEHQDIDGWKAMIASAIRAGRANMVEAIANEFLGYNSLDDSYTFLEWLVAQGHMTADDMELVIEGHEDYEDDEL